MGSFDDGGYDLCTSQPYHFTPHSDCLVYSFGSVCFSLLLSLSVCLSVSSCLCLTLVSPICVIMLNHLFIVSSRTNHLCQLKSVLHTGIVIVIREV